MWLAVYGFAEFYAGFLGGFFAVDSHSVLLVFCWRVQNRSNSVLGSDAEVFLRCHGRLMFLDMSFSSFGRGDSQSGIVTILSHHRHQRSTPHPLYPISVLFHSWPVSIPQAPVSRRCTPSCFGPPNGPHLRFIQRGQQYQSCGYAMRSGVWFFGWQRATHKKRCRTNRATQPTPICSSGESWGFGGMAGLFIVVWSFRCGCVR